MSGAVATFVATVQDWPVLHFAMFTGVAALFAGATFVGSYRKFRAYRVVEDTPRAKVRSAPQGYVELQGEWAPVGDAAKTAPFSDKRCVWYEARVEEKRGSGENESWDTIFEEHDPRPAALRDETGTALVLPALADMRVATEDETFYPPGLLNIGDDPPDPIQHVDTSLFSKSIRFRETRIEAGPGYVVGAFTTIERGDDAGDANAAHDGEDLAGDAVSVMEQWRTDYMGEIEGRPDKHQPNPINTADELAALEGGRLPQAAARWAARQAELDGRIPVVGPTDEARRPFIVGAGEDDTVASKLCMQWMGLGALFVVAATAAGAMTLARLGALG